MLHMVHFCFVQCDLFDVHSLLLSFIRSVNILNPVFQTLSELTPTAGMAFSVSAASLLLTALLLPACK